jgi:DNA-binding response OmpR family regulator
MTGSVLVVEDDSTLARAISRNLVARGYETRCAVSVAEAVTSLQATRPALVLLDIDLPDGSGWEVLRDMRARYSEDVAVIVMSALRPNPRLVGDLRCAGFLEKPFPMESLLRQVIACLDRPERSASAETNA